MMLDMSATASSMMEETTMQQEHMPDSDHHADMLSMSSEHCQSQNSADDSCDEHHNCNSCLAHCSSAALMTDVSVLNTSHRFTFESDYHLWDAPSTYSRLLRPPKFA